MIDLTWNPGVTVESVEELYARHAAMDIPGYYQGTEVNPYEGRTKVVPRKANFYVMVSSADAGRASMARKVLKGLAGRRKVREVLCEKDEINYNQFAPPGRILVLYV